jgi:hypothetical protein
MATTSKSKDTPTSEATVSRIRELNKAPVRLAKKSGQAYLDTFENALQSVLNFEKAAAHLNPLNWVSELADTHTKFVQNVTSPYIKIARDALK